MRTEEERLNDTAGRPARAGQSLRARAEAQARVTDAQNLGALSPEQARRLVHDLRVHQIELEMQNEELRQAQQALEASRARYFDLYDLAPVGYFTLNEHGLILEANSRAAALLGVPRGSLIKQPLARSVFREDEDIYYLYRKKLFATGEPQVCELRMLRQDGASFWTRLEATVARDGETGALVCRATLSDLTERKQAEEERERLHAQKMESVARLAGAVAHDFNNLLTVINGHSEILLSMLAPADPLWTGISEIQRAGEVAAALTRQLLAVGRQQGMRPQSLSVDRIIGDIHPILQRLVGEEVEVRVVANAGRALIHADPHQVEQIILNLVVNARDAMPGGGKVTIETTESEWGPDPLGSHPGARPGRCLLLVVSDSGSGMDAATRQRIFEPFFTTKRTGTGLGLSVVHDIVTQRGGRIEVSSEPGRGSTFRIYLPLTDEAVAGAAAPAEPSPMAGAETVLVVEDRRDVREYAAAALRAHGYRVLMAENVSEALFICEGGPEPVDLVLTDVVMPNLSGRELADRLKETQPQVRVLFMSGYDDHAVTHQGAKDEGVNFIQKPFSPKQLAHKVREVMGPRNA